jgi:hypothetical protein
MQPDIIRRVFMDHALRMERFHQTHGSQRQADAFLQDSPPQLIHSRLPPPKSRMKRGEIEVAERAQGRDAHQSGLFLSGYDFKIDLGLMTYSFDQNVAVGGFAGRARGHGAIRG